MSNQFGVTANGFRRKSYNDILSNLQARAREVFGDNINLSNTSFLGMWLQNEAWEIAELWELAEDVYFSAYVDTSEGTSLDGVGKYITVSRKPAQRSKGIITVEGKEGTIIPKGFKVGNEQLEKVFETTESGVIGESGNIDIPIISINLGLNQNVPASTLIKMVNPISGIDKIYNKDATVDGRGTETDSEFRERYYNSIARAGASTIDSITASLLDVEDVRTAMVIENTTNEVDSDGRPPKSIQCYVLGGTKKLVAEAIFSTKPAGMETFGDEVETVVDLSGRSHTIKFSYANVKYVYLTIDLVRNSKYREDGDQLIKSEIIKYIGGYDYDGQLYNGLNIRQDVIFTKLVTAISKVDGVEDFTLTIGLSNDNLQSSNIEIQPIEVAETSLDRIVINYV